MIGVGNVKLDNTQVGERNLTQKKEEEGGLSKQLVVKVRQTDSGCGKEAKQNLTL